MVSICLVYMVPWGFVNRNCRKKQFPGDSIDKFNKRHSRKAVPFINSHFYFALESFLSRAAVQARTAQAMTSITTRQALITL